MRRWKSVCAALDGGCIMQFWNNFVEKHPAAAKWVREGGLFVIVSNLITVFKYLLLQFLPAAFSSLPVVDFGWPGVAVTLLGKPSSGTSSATMPPTAVCRTFARI